MHITETILPAVSLLLLHNLMPIKMVQLVDQRLQLQTLDFKGSEETTEFIDFLIKENPPISDSIIGLTVTESLKKCKKTN